MKTVEPMQRIVSYLGTTFGIDITNWSSVEKAIDTNQLSKIARVEVNTLAGAILELGTSELLLVFHSREENPETEKKVISDYLATIIEEDLAHHRSRVKEQVKELVATSIKVWSKEFRMVIHLLLLFDGDKPTGLLKSLTKPLADYAVRCIHKGFKERQKVAEDGN